MSDAAAGPFADPEAPDPILEGLNPDQSEAVALATDVARRARFAG